MSVSVAEPLKGGRGGPGAGGSAAVRGRLAR